MNGKIWLSQIPIALIFSALYWVSENAQKGSLDYGFLREKIYPPLQSLHGKHTDLKFLIRGNEAPKNKIVIVEIDGDSINEYGRWPWHRDLTASLIQNTFDAGAKFVGLDMVFSERDERLSKELNQLLEKKGLQAETTHFETDHSLKDVITFNAEKLTLGWTPEILCQPRYDSSGECDFKSLQKNSQKDSTLTSFALNHSSINELNSIANTPFPVVVQSLQNHPFFQNEAKSIGSFYATQDADGTIRKSSLLFLDPKGNYYPSLPLELARKALDEEIIVNHNEHFKVDSVKFKKSNREIYTTPLGLLEINFRGPAQTFQYVRAMEVMHPSDEIRLQKGRAIATASKKEILKDAIVLIGVSALGVFDMRSFPFDSNTPGVEGHATILDNLLSGDMLRTTHTTSQKNIIFFLLIGGLLLFAYIIERLEAIPALLFIIIILSSGFFIDQRLFNKNINIHSTLLYLEYFLVFIFIFCAKYILEERNKKFIKGAFAKYVSPAVIDSILEDPKKLALGGEKKEVTILFSDIRSFTSFSEKMDAKVLAEFLNEYLGVMTDIVFDTGGTLDKYIGDAVMAFWGAPLNQPDHALKACEAALKMQEKLAEMRPHFKTKYDINVEIGIGINSGYVNVGNMGSERVFEYTVIGDHVNLASRLEGLTKEYFSKILTTRFTLDCISNAGKFFPQYRVIDLVKVKGKDKAIELIELTGGKIESETFQFFNEARKLYSQKNWDEAIRNFKESKEPLSEVFIERCEYFKQNPPPENWDGSWVMKTK